MCNESNIYSFKVPFSFFSLGERCLIIPSWRGEKNQYLSFWNEVGKVVLIECPDGNSTVCKYPHCSKTPSAPPPQDTELVAAGHLWNWDSCNQWQMCHASVCDCDRTHLQFAPVVLLRPEWRCEYKTQRASQQQN